MSTLSRILSRDSYLFAHQREWLHHLTGEWQIIADITFSDLILYVRTDRGVVVAAQARPATAATVHQRDFVGEPTKEWKAELIEKAGQSGQEIFTEDDGVNIRLVPVSCQGEIIAVMGIVTAKFVDRVPTVMLANYESIADTLVSMVMNGEFPIDGSPSGYRHGTPRVTDGLIHVDCEGSVIYASPNAISHLRRLGVEKPLLGEILAEAITDDLDGVFQIDEALPVVLTGRAAWMAELERNDVVVSFRAVPLIRMGERQGAIVLCRDITELRRQERELMSKDSTIREINHRVKNNLQTVSALLRLQARRAGEGMTRMALETAQRRVATIAVVHEKLSQTIDEVVDFDQVFVPVMRMVRDTAVTDNPVVTTFEGDFGRVRAEQATALGVVMNEIISNAIEHGLPKGGRLDIKAQRDAEKLHIEIADDGRGMGENHPTGLGTQIVKTMVVSELKGRIAWQERSGGGTVVVLDLIIRS
ncbi:sensor histidine kinase [Trueperella pecoris]|uniref:sensor histidine kinase n=1 Tax=Trueperella pecoris TaxID=2733571 RepID=UPI00186BA70A|nr:histidine kinase N-terminal domain-containing protein [Trueperella pecoris]QOQ39195.1 PAS domain-containing protein [Trueperella pecoris]QTG75998.1 histidine kinase N-terminal domain-containing protein [Trueperella pecoris]